MVGKEGCKRGDVKRCTQAVAALAIVSLKREAWQTAECARHGPSSLEQGKPFAQELRVVEIFNGKHRPDAVLEADHGSAFDVGGSAVRCGFGVHGFEFGGEVKHVARMDRCEEVDACGDAR